MPTSQDLNAYFVDQTWLSNSCSLQKLDIKISAFVPRGAATKSGRQKCSVNGMA